MKKSIGLFVAMCVMSLCLLVGCQSSQPTTTDDAVGTEGQEDAGAAESTDTEGQEDTGAEESTDTEESTNTEGQDTTETGDTDKTQTVTYTNLLNAVQGETIANASYVAFAEVADQEGQAVIAKVFRALADAELKHADDEFAIAMSYGATERPTAPDIVTGTTKENLQTAINGETEEYTNMYPGYLKISDEENFADASHIFSMAMQAEEVHAGIYTDLLNNYDNIDEEKYTKLYRCPVCGNIELAPPANCPICGVAGDQFIEY